MYMTGQDGHSGYWNQSAWAQYRKSHRDHRLVGISSTPTLRIVLQEGFLGAYSQMYCSGLEDESRLLCVGYPRKTTQKKLKMTQTPFPL